MQAVNMWHMCILCYAIVIQAVVFYMDSVTGTLSDRLEYYETIHHRDISHIIHKRHAHTLTPNRREIDIPVLGRNLHLYLYSNYHLLAADFKAYVVDGQGDKDSFAVDQDSFYQGYVKDESQSDVEAYWEDENLHAVIHTPKDVYYIEPSWRHLPHSTNYTMIAYKESDIKKAWNNSHHGHKGDAVCGFVRPEEELSDPLYATSVNEERIKSTGDREKRQSGSGVQSVCPILLVADYKFFKEMGLLSVSKTSSYLINLINSVNQYYKNVSFDGQFDNMGFEIKELRIHNSSTPVEKPSKLHYNMVKSNWETRSLLEVFSSNDFNSYCLAHLFTYSQFTDGVLGLAYIGSSRANGVGGICSSAHYKGGKALYLNTGWTTAQNRQGNRILTQEANLVTTHEFGHNWGSEHDPDNDECSPSSFDGAKYIMYTYSVSGFEPNNKKFSPCSKRSIAAVLKSKSHRCFRAPHAGFCGNYRKEEYGSMKEQCDAGAAGTSGHDACCNADCTLKAGKTCSDYNSPCCVNCQMAPPDHICRKQPNGTLSCQGDWKCAGNRNGNMDSWCTLSNDHTSRDNKTCTENGRCRNGQCIPFCELHNKISCMCDEATNACKFCCRDNNTAPCKVLIVADGPADGTVVPDFRPCYSGYCERGSCKKQLQDFTERVWTIIENIDIDFVVEFMKDNIVGTIILFSMFIWIPASCVISHIDRKRLQKEEDEANWHRKNDMFRQKDIKKIKESEITRRRPQPRGEAVTVI